MTVLFFFVGFVFYYMNVCERCVGEPTIATVCVEANFLFFPPWVLETKLRSFDLVVSIFLCTATLLLFLKYFVRRVMVT